MATFTLVTAIVPYASQWRDSGVTVVRFSSAAAATITTIADAGGAGTRHVIVAGRVSYEGAGGFDICSAATTIDQIEFAARGTAFLPVGLECAENEVLAFTNADAVATRGWVAWVTLKDGQYCGLL